MRVTLNQDELFGAIADHLRDKLNLSNTASIEISFTAGRSPKGYTADVEITYPKSDLAEKCVARPHQEAETPTSDAGETPATPDVPAPTTASQATVAAGSPDPTAGGAVPDNLFS